MMSRALLFLFICFVGLACSESDGVAPAVEDVAAEPITIEVDRFAHVRRWGVPEGEDFDQGIGPTHGGVAVDAAGAIYTSADRGVYVFDAAGTLLRKLEDEPLRGLHCLSLAEDEEGEVLWGAANNRAEIVKFRTSGEVLLRLGFPAESGVNGTYRPTGIAVTPAGHVLVADGYGTNFIYEFDAAGNYLRHFGGPGAEDPARFRTPHGIAIDDRFDPPRVLIADREKRRLVHYSLEGDYVGEITTGLRRPCAVSLRGPYVAVAELEGRVAILDGDNELLGVLGDNPGAGQRANYGVAPADWQPGIHTAPHGLCWGATGDLYVQDWNATGRLTKWRYRHDGAGR